MCLVVIDLEDEASEIDNILSKGKVTVRISLDDALQCSKISIRAGDKSPVVGMRRYVGDTSRVMSASTDAARALTSASLCSSIEQAIADFRPMSPAGQGPSEANVEGGDDDGSDIA